MARGRPLGGPRRKLGEGSRFRPPSDAFYIGDWTSLAPGEKVVITDTTAELRGQVDAVAENGLILWLHLEDGAGRRLFTRTDGVQVWRLASKR